jgi:cytochrome P450
MKGHGSYMLGEKFTVVIEDLDDLKTIFYAEETFEKSYPYKFFFKNGLFTDVGEKYKLQRKAISPLFNPSSIRSFIPITNEKVDEFLNSFSGNIEGKKIDARVLTFNFTTNTVFKTLFGKQKHLSDETVESMRHTGEE